MAETSVVVSGLAEQGEINITNLNDLQQDVEDMQGKQHILDNDIQSKQHILTATSLYRFRMII